MKKGSKTAFLWITLLIFAAIWAPFGLSKSAEAMNFSHLLEAPSWEHLLGTDSLGRDLLARVLCGASISLGVGLVAVGLSVLVGTILGAVAGYYEGLCGKIIMTFVDIMLCFPTFFLILAVIAVLGPNIVNIMVIIGFTSWMGTARLVRAEILKLKGREFILATRALGATDGRIIFKHLIPNALGPVIVSAVLGIPVAILTEGGLSFLGIGVQPPTPSWGNILTDGKATLGAAWWLLFFPGAMIFLTVLSVNVLGEHLRERIMGDR